MVWAVDTVPREWDWLRCSDAACWAHAHLVARGLFASRLRESRPVKELADRWSSSATDLHIKIKTTVSWSDGVPFQAQDVVESWRAVLERCQEQPAAEILFPITGARSFCEKKIPFEKVGIRTTADEIVISLKGGHDEFLLALAHPVTWPSRGVTPSGPEKMPVLGDFKVARVESGAITYVPNGERPEFGFSTLEVRAVADPARRLQLFLERSVDFAGPVPAELSRQVNTRPGYSVVADGGVVALAILPTKKAFYQAAARREFLRGIDRTELISRLLSAVSVAEGFVRTRPLPSSVLKNFEFSSLPSGIDKRISWWRKETDTAPENLVERVVIGWLPSVPEAEVVAESIRAQWGKRGEVKIDHFGPGKANPSLLLLSLAPRWGVPGTEFRPLFENDLLALHRPRRLDALLSLIKETPLATEKEALLLEADRLLVEETVFLVPLYESGFGVLSSKEMNGFARSASGFLYWP